MVRVFISYRREDTRHLSARVYEQFEPTFGESVFFDVDTLPRYAGMSFPNIIRNTVPQCQVFLAIIGPQWVRLMQQRLNDADDFVQIEIGLALETPGVRVIPVLVDGATMPRVDELPPRLRGLLERQAIVLPHDPHFRNAVRELSRNLASGGAATAASDGQEHNSEVSRSGRSRPGSVWREPIPGVPESASPEMVTIPPGKFLMGSPKTEELWKEYDGREEPQHEVWIDYTFAFSKHPVTFAEWDAAIAAGAKLEKPGDQGWGRDRRPVINVSWNDAKAYIAWLNSKLGLEGRADAYRLPGEAEWEYACRAGTTTPFGFGATISTAQANYNGECTYGAGKKGEKRGKTAPVGSFPANGFGLHDMHGNVWEWCEDVWNANYNGAPADGSAWLTGNASFRVLRGGSWNNPPEYLRSAFRFRLNPSGRFFSVGFRVARTL
jgi:formylglycine-generating enzyme required for sulfatase activity